MYVYRRSECCLWTVGFYDPSGVWNSESDHESTEAAAKRVAWLNGAKAMLEDKTNDVRLELLREALCEVLRKVGVLNNDTKPTGPEVLMAAREYIAEGESPEDLRRGAHRMFMVAVLAAGGQIKVADLDVEALNLYELHSERNERTLETVYTMNRKG